MIDLLDLMQTTYKPSLGPLDDLFQQLSFHNDNHENHTNISHQQLITLRHNIQRLHAVLEE